jgi:hypothetical protein
MKWLALIATGLLACGCADSEDDGQGHWIGYYLAEGGDTMNIVLTDDFVLDRGVLSRTEAKPVKSNPNHSVRATRKGTEINFEILDGEAVKATVRCAPIDTSFQGFQTSATMDDGTHYDLEFVGRKATCNAPAPPSS